MLLFINARKPLDKHPGCQETLSEGHDQVFQREEGDESSTLPYGTCRIHPSSLCPCPRPALSGEGRTLLSAQGITAHSREQGHGKGAITNIPDTNITGV